jgi:hypothetical protein
LLEIAIPRQRIPIKSVPYSFLIERDTGYVRIIRFSATTGHELQSALTQLEASGMQRLVLDLRGNPGGYLEQAVEVAQQFVPAGQMVVYTKGRVRGASEEHYAAAPGGPRNLPVVVLVNHATASAAEIVAGALQDWDRGLIVGQPPARASCKRYRLRDGSAVFLTVGRYYTPSGDSSSGPMRPTRSPTMLGATTTSTQRRAPPGRGASLPDRQRAGLRRRRHHAGRACGARSMIEKRTAIASSNLLFLAPTMSGAPGTSIRRASFTSPTIRWTSH